MDKLPSYKHKLCTNTMRKQGPGNEVGACDGWDIRLCPSRREALGGAERFPDGHRTHLDEVVSHHQAQELSVCRFLIYSYPPPYGEWN